MALAKFGATVYITGRDRRTINAAAAEINSVASHGKCIAVSCDHAKSVDTRRAFQTALEGGRLDILVNNACDPAHGLQPGEFWWERDTMEHYDSHTSVGLRSHYEGTLLATQAMSRQRNGLIV